MTRRRRGRSGGRCCCASRTILDDLANTDTDLAYASQAANPNMVYSGSRRTGVHTRRQCDRPPENATAAFMDTSKNLTALTGHVDTLLGRLAVNARLAQALLGRVQPNGVPSGYALELGFAPAKNLLREMRTVRDEVPPPAAVCDAPRPGWWRPARRGCSSRVDRARVRAAC